MSSDRVIEITVHSGLCILSDDLFQYYLKVGAMEIRKRPKEPRKRSNEGNERDNWAGSVTVCYAHTWKTLASEALSGIVCQLLSCDNICYRNNVREKESILTPYFCPSYQRKHCEISS